MKNHTLLGITFVVLTTLWQSPHAHADRCGGEERWAVKVGTDSGASNVDLSNKITSQAIEDILKIPTPQMPSHNDDDTRLAEETKVYVLRARLVKFKREDGKSGDQDYHLVMSDDTLKYTPGKAKTASGHSFIAEIPDPACYSGKKGPTNVVSRFDAQIKAVRQKLEERFPKINREWNDAAGVPVLIEGIAFFDRPHGQVGRAPNNLEIHPVLNLTFLDEKEEITPEPPATVQASNLIQNGGFEEGEKAWITTPSVITDDHSEYNGEKARRGHWKAWLGGQGGEAEHGHTDWMYQEISIPKNSTQAKLAFYLKVSTHEDGSKESDTLKVQIRNKNGKWLKTVARYTNRNAGNAYKLETIDLMAYRGKTIRVHFVSNEDAELLTSFVIDNVSVRVK